MNLLCQQWNSQKQNADVAEKNHHGGKQIALRRDVRLPRFQSVKCQCHMKSISRADEQMKPDQRPAPKKAAEREHADDNDGVKRKKIRRERDDEICLGDDNVTAFGSDFHFLDRSAKKPRPKRMGQFVAEDVNPHRLWKQEKNHSPT